MLRKLALGPPWGGLMGAGFVLYVQRIATASMHESVHMSSESMRKFRENEKIDRNSEIREI